MKVVFSVFFPFLIVLISCGRMAEGSQISGIEKSLPPFTTQLKKLGYCVKFNVEDPPPFKLKRTYMFTIGFWKAEDCSTLSSEYVEFPYPLNKDTVMPWMPEHNHGSPTHPIKIEKVTEKKQVIYKGSNLAFIMPGDWELRVIVKEEGVQEIGATPVFKVR